MRELLDSFAGPGLGPLECRLLLQPSKALAKLQKRKASATKALLKLRADPLRVKLSEAWRERRMPPRRLLVQEDAQSSQWRSQRRPESSSKTRRGPAPEGIRGMGHRSLPVLGLGQSLLPSSGEAQGTGAKNLPSLGAVGTQLHPSLASLDAHPSLASLDAGSGNASPLSAAGRSRASQGSQARRVATGLQASASESAGRSRRGCSEQISLRKALGLPEAAEGHREGSHSRSRSCGGIAQAARVAVPNRPQSSTTQRRSDAGLFASRPQSSAGQRAPQAATGTLGAGATSSSEPARRVCAWAYPQASQASQGPPKPMSAGGLPFAPSGMPWVTPMR